MISATAFRKPQRRRNLRGQRRDSEDSDGNTASPRNIEEDSNGSKEVSRNASEDDEDDEGLAALKSSIAKFKDKKTKKNKGISSTGAGFSKAVNDKKVSSQLLTFEDPFGHDDESEVFQVKKSSQSRRLIKQKKAEKKLRKLEKKEQRKPQQSDCENGSSSENDEQRPGPQLAQHQKSNVIEPELDIKFKDTLQIKKKEEKTWTLSGKDAEALHMEEEDLEDSDENEKQTKGVLQTGSIPDANAIHAARKKRQAAREREERGQPQESQVTRNDYIPLSERKPRKHGGRLDHNEDEDKDFSDEERISFTGVKSASRDRVLRQSQYHRVEQHSAADEGGEDEDEEGPDAWEQMQIRKAMPGAQMESFALASTMKSNQPKGPVDYQDNYGQNGVVIGKDLAKPAEYNLQGIKGRLKERLLSRTEVHRRHQSDADRAVDELIESQNEIVRLEAEIPGLAKRHGFYQELRGYVTDLVECFNEKVVNIVYLEEKFHKSKSAVAVKQMTRRRDDVRDQMIELSSKPPSVVQLSAQQQQDEAVAEAARQRRAAERDGRRRRRVQNRQKDPQFLARQLKHFDGMSSDDELTTLELAGLSKARQDVENQARQVLSDVVEDFSTISGIKERFETWKEEDRDSYTDAYVSLCLPKIFSPLVRLQLLFWNPFSDHDIEQMEWYKSLSTFSYLPTESSETLSKDPDRILISLMVEKVVLPKLTSLIRGVYDPMSTTQTVRVTALINKLVKKFPTLRGDSKQVRELITATKEKIKTCVSNDPYIPIGYTKQLIENPNGGHANFVHRQFWSCYKLFKNTLAWHGILGDGILADLALNSLLNKYLLIGLGFNPDAMDAITKSSHITRALPSEWREEKGICHEELAKFALYLTTLAKAGKGLGRDKIQEIVSLLKCIGYNDHADTVTRLKLK